MPATGASAQGLPKVSSQSLPKVSSQGLPKVSSQSLPKVSSQGLPKVGGESTKASAQGLPRVTSEQTPRASAQDLKAVGPTPQDARPVKQTNPFQKALRASGFDKNENEQINLLMGRAKRLDLDEDETDANGNPFFDGETPAPKVTTKSTWRAVPAPVKSRPSKRVASLLWTVIDQFAVGNNPRYSVAEGAESRAHIFAWDVSLAMDCPIPHHRSGREMTLVQTLDWFRYESANAGWTRCDAAGAVEAADRGQLVFVIARNSKVRQLAIVRPGGAGDDGLPRVASAGSPRGNDLGVTEAIGPDAVYFTHV